MTNNGLYDNRAITKTQQGILIAIFKNEPIKLFKNYFLLDTATLVKSGFNPSKIRGDLSELSERGLVILTTLHKIDDKILDRKKIMKKYPQLKNKRTKMVFLTTAGFMVAYALSSLTEDDESFMERDVNLTIFSPLLPSSAKSGLVS